MTPTPDAGPDRWLSAARARLGSVTAGPERAEIGRVESVGDGVAMVVGLPDACLDELLRFEGGGFGYVQSLERRRIGCVLLDAEGIESGHVVHRTGDVLRVPVGEGLLGRTVDPLGRPLDGGEPVEAADHLPIERPAPRIVERELVTRPMQTGLLVVDTLFPLGRGQRELLIGDRSTGKTTVAVDTILNQRDTDVACVYVAIGQKTSSVRRVMEVVRARGDPGRCIFVVAAAAGAPGLRWIAPFAGMSMAEYFRDHGRDALIVLDDLTKHAASHREIALLTRRPPGREAYPGDVFYLHARLLERAGRLSKERGGGSLTALPVALTEAGNLTAYIPTNLISITDGQIVLDAQLFHLGQKPAVDVGTSVSRVGGKTQAPALREASESLRLDYAQFLELESFTRFGGLPDQRIRKQLVRGARIRAVITQRPHAPLRLEDEVALVLALRSGLLDGLSLDGVERFRAVLPGRLDERGGQLVEEIRSEGTLSDAARRDLQALLAQVAGEIAAEGGTAEDTGPEGPPAPESKDSGPEPRGDASPALRGDASPGLDGESAPEPDAAAGGEATP